MTTFLAKVEKLAAIVSSSDKTVSSPPSTEAKPSHTMYESSVS